METYTKNICVFKYIYIDINICIYIDINTSCCSITKSCLTLCDPMDCSTPSFSVLHHFQEFVQTHAIESVMPSHQHIVCCSLLLPSVFPNIKVFSNELGLHIRWLKYWKFYWILEFWSSTETNKHEKQDYFVAVQFSRSVMSNTLRPHESQHVRPPCPSPTPGVHSHINSSQFKHMTIV